MLLVPLRPLGVKKLERTATLIGWVGSSPDFDHIFSRLNEDQNLRKQWEKFVQQSPTRNITDSDPYDWWSGAAKAVSAAAYEIFVLGDNRGSTLYGLLPDSGVRCRFESEISGMNGVMSKIRQCPCQCRRQLRIHQKIQEAVRSTG